MLVVEGGGGSLSIKWTVLVAFLHCMINFMGWWLRTCQWSIPMEAERYKCVYMKCTCIMSFIQLVWCVCTCVTFSTSSYTFFFFFSMIAFSSIPPRLTASLRRNRKVMQVFLIYLFKFFWSIVDLQGCDSLLKLLKYSWFTRLWFTYLLSFIEV